ncbi:MAG: hypothetical protein J6K21_03145 [Bacilli bacterium]|nr:hypothetical protein [Bacilli bacterium]
MNIFDNRNRVEGYIFSENENAYSSNENRNNYLKEEITAKFVQLSKKNTCKKVEKIESEYTTKYVATFVDRIPLSIIIYSNTLELNKDIVSALDNSVSLKKDKKFSFINKKALKAILVGGGIALATIPIGNIIVDIDNKNFDEETKVSQELYIEHVGPIEENNNYSTSSVIDKIIDMDNKNYDEETKISQELYDEQKMYEFHQEAVEQRELDRRQEQIKEEQQAQELINYMDEQQTNYEEEQRKLLEDAREYDMNQIKAK